MIRLAHLFVVVLLALACGNESNAAQSAPTPISIPTEDGGLIFADLYGKGRRGVVLAHGSQFNKESWAEEAHTLASKGFRVLAFDFRGYGQSRGSLTSTQPDQGREFDVLAAIRYLRANGAKTVSVIGASMGGDYATEAAEREPEAMDRLVLLAAGAYKPLIKMTGPKLFIMAAGDIISENTPRILSIRAQYDKASPPKRFVELEGRAHAQFLFASAQRDKLMREILKFISAR